MNACPVYLIDDDAAVRDALAWLLRSCGIGSQLYASAEEFLASYQPTMSGVIVLDIRMEGMSGLELFDRLLTLECLWEHAPQARLEGFRFDRFQHFVLADHALWRDHLAQAAVVELLARQIGKDDTVTVWKT